MGEKIKDRESVGLCMAVASESVCAPENKSDIFETSEKTTTKSNQKNNQKSQHSKSKINKKACKMYMFWVIGLIISFIPLLAVPFSQKITGETDVNFFDTVFKSAEIIFIGISLAISALNTYIHPSSKTHSDIWIWSNIIVIILGALFYGVIVTHEQQSADVDLTFLIYFNAFFFVLVFLLGSYKYIMNIFNIKDLYHIKDLFGGYKTNG